MIFSLKNQTWLSQKLQISKAECLLSINLLGQGETQILLFNLRSRINRPGNESTCFVAKQAGIEAVFFQLLSPVFLHCGSFFSDSTQCFAARLYHSSCFLPNKLTTFTEAHSKLRCIHFVCE